MIKLYSFHFKSKTLQFCFLYLFRPPLCCGNEESDFQIATNMRYFFTQTNHLHMEVESGNLLKKRYSWKIDDEGISVAEFLIYTEEEIRELTLGVYQVRLAGHYTQEQIDPDHDIVYGLTSTYPVS